MLLLAIKPVFAAAIYAGTKRFEFRRIAPRRDIPGPALIYESAPVSAITGMVTIVERRIVEAAGTAALAGAEDTASGHYAPYLHGATAPCALALADPRQFRAAVPLADLVFAPRRPPQSFCYVADAPARAWLDLQA